MVWWSLWWVWFCGGLVLAILELLIPGFIFLGIAIGAGLTAGVVAFLPGVGLSTLLAIFGGLSLISWLALRRIFKSPDDQTRVIHKDINK